MKRVRFTEKELALIHEMTGIANAGAPGGDYQDWDTAGKYKTTESLDEKVAELRYRKRQ